MILFIDLIMKMTIMKVVYCNTAQNRGQRQSLGHKTIRLTKTPSFAYTLSLCMIQTRVPAKVQIIMSQTITLSQKLMEPCMLNL